MQVVMSRVGDCVSELVPEQVPELVLEGVTLQAGPVTVLDRVTFRTPLDGITLLAGRNGAGKTTLLQALVGVNAPARGRIMLGGQPPRAMRRQIGYMPQNDDDTALMLPVASHVAAAIGAGRLGFAWKTRRASIHHALALVGAEALANRPLDALSGGERKRVALARALVDHPRLLLLDEPLAGLDHRAQGDILALLHALTREAGVGVLLTSHEGAALGDVVGRVLELGEGRLDARV